MQITRNRTDSSIGPADWFSGIVLIDTITNPTAPSRVAAANVHFMPGARTHWHTHPLGQTIWVTEGVGLCQRRGGPVEVIWPGDRVLFAPGEEHWHGASPTRLLVHVAIHEADDNGSTVSWGEPVSDADYGSAPRVEDPSQRPG